MYMTMGVGRCLFLPFGPLDFCFFNLLLCCLLEDDADQLECLDLMGFFGSTKGSEEET